MGEGREGWGREEGGHGKNIQQGNVAWVQRMALDMTDEEEEGSIGE
jgi:hypothetical protein